MTVTIYYQPVDRKMLKQAKKMAKENEDSISRVAVEAIRGYYLAHGSEAVDEARKAKNKVKR